MPLAWDDHVTWGALTSVDRKIRGNFSRQIQDAWKVFAKGMGLNEDQVRKIERNAHTPRFEIKELVNAELLLQLDPGVKPLNFRKLREILSQSSHHSWMLRILDEILGKE